MKIHMHLHSTTKTCYRFERRDNGELITLYLKKKDIEEAGIDPKNGIIITVEEDTNNA